MSHTELKRFTFIIPPTGSQLVTLIDNDNLQDWNVSIEQKRNEGGGMYMPHELYRYEVTFSRTVS